MYEYIIRIYHIIATGVIMPHLLHLLLHVWDPDLANTPFASPQVDNNAPHKPLPMHDHNCVELVPKVVQHGMGLNHMDYGCVR